MQAVNRRLGTRMRIGYSKRQLGVDYVAAAGLVLGLGALVQLLFAVESGAAVGPELVSGLVLALALASASYWLPRSSLDGEQIWAVATWAGVGIGVLALVGVGIVLVHRFVGTGLSVGAIVLINNVAAGGVAGVLVGWIRELNTTSRTLHRKNAVTNRVLQRDLVHDINAVRRRVDDLEDDLPKSYAPRLGAIKQTLDDMSVLTENARRLQASFGRTDGDAIGTPIDVATAVEHGVDRVRSTHPRAEVDLDLPVEAWVDADELLAPAIEALLTAAIDGATNRPRIALAVAGLEATGGDRVEVRIETGSRLPAAERRVLSGGVEMPLDYGGKLGVWLLPWLVESYGGALSVEETGTGDVVRLELPAAQPTARDRLAQFTR